MSETYHDAGHAGLTGGYNAHLIVSFSKGQAMSKQDIDSPLSVLILSRDADQYLALLQQRHFSGVRWLTASDPGSLPEGATQATVALGEPDLLAVSIPRLPHLQWVQSTWAGLTPLVPAAATGLAVTGIKGVFGQQMSEYVLAYALSHFLQLPARARAQALGEWMPQANGTLAGKTVGIMGTGSIGAAIARQFVTFGTHVVGFSRSGRPVDDFAGVFAHDALSEFLESLEVLVAVLPDTPETSGLLDAARLRCLPAGALLINVGRGSLIVEADLVDVMNQAHLGGAVLDVFQTEPLPPDHPFWRTPGLTITAHVAARSWPRDIAGIFAGNLQRFRDGRALHYLLSPGRGY